MKKTISLLLCLALCLTLTGFVGVTKANAAAPEGVTVGELASARMTFNGVSRLYYYYVPSTYDGHRMPMMFALHGSGLNALWQLNEGKFVEFAEREGVIVVAPNAVAIHQDGTISSEGYTSTQLGVSADKVRWCAGMFDPQNAYGIDDVGYICALRQLFVDKGLADGNRVFSCGISHGACMSIRLAVEASDKFAGIGSVSGLLFSQYVYNVPSNKMKLVFVHGNLDPVVPITGMVYGGWIFAYDLDYTISWFMNHYGMTGTPSVTPLAPINLNDPTRIYRYDYGTDGGKASVVKYFVDGGGHTWPGGTQYAPAAWVGPLSTQAQASDLIWKELKIDVNVTATASVEKLNGNQNTLTVNLVKTYSNGVVDVTTKTFTINNNADGTFKVDDYNVYVDTNGNVQVRECYVVD